MSNRLDVQYTKFVDINDEGKEIETSWGFRVFDSYGKSYDNFYESFEQLKEQVNPKTILSVLENLDQEMHDYARDNGIAINNKYYGPNEL